MIEQAKRVLLLAPNGPRALRDTQVVAWAVESYFEHADAHRCDVCSITHRMDGGDVCDCDGTLVPLYDDGTTCPSDLDACIGWLEAHAEAIFDHGESRSVAA